jgi:CubicO group peptidase (beta-lactamase class C family)
VLFCFSRKTIYLPLHLFLVNLINHQKTDFMKKLLIIILSLSTSYTSFSQKNIQIVSIKQLTDSIQVIMRQQQIPGLMMGITKGDSVLFSGGFGYADLDEKRLVDSKTLFRMGSNTKMFVSLGILKLVQEGRLNLNDELKKIAPEVPFKNDWEVNYPIRIVHLLEHTTGFDDIKLNRMYSLDGKDRTNFEMMMIHAPSMVCRWKPGERHAYSNPNYAILGYLIEKITKKPYEKYLTETILQPLGMANTNFNTSSKLPNQDVKEYIVRGGKIEKVPSVTLLSGPQGSLWSCADDMLKFLQMFLRKGSPIFTENTITEMETPHSSLGAKAGLKSGYALGNYDTHFYNKFLFRGHNGLTGTCFSTCIYNHELGVGYVIASNGNNDNERIEELIASFLEQNAIKTPIKTQILDKNAIEPFLGFYQFESPRNKIAAFRDKLLIGSNIFIENDTLYKKDLMGNKDALLQVTPLTFLRKGMNTPTVAFTKNDEGKNVKMEGGAYSEQSSYFLAIISRLLLIIAIFFAISSIILGVFSIVMTLIGKAKWREILPKTLPAIAVFALLMGINSLLEVQVFTNLLYELNDINTRTLIIFIGTLTFGILAIICLIIAIQQFRNLKNRWFAWYYLLSSLSMFYVAIILFQNDWLGLRTWAM